MPRLLALEWDSREARMAVAWAKAGSVVIEQAFAIPLPSRAEAVAAADEATAEVIGAALAARKLGRVECLVAVGRASIELKQLTLPPAPTDELPDMVRFQALREFTSLGEDWPLDFIPLGNEGEGPRQVLAAAIAPELVQQIKDTCNRAGVTPERLVLRPCAAVSLVRRAHGPSAERVRLLVDILSDEADLTVSVEEQVVFLRTARLPGDVLAGAEASRPLLGEIRRTIAAAQNQLGGQKVERITLFGSGPEHAALGDRLAADLALPVDLFDPFAALDLARDLKRSPPARTERFAPLLGMLLDEAQQVPPAIDFLNPRRRPPPPDRRRTFAWTAAAAALLLVLGGAWIWWGLRRLDDDITALRTRSTAADPVVEEARKLEQSASEIEKWTATDIVWLDELHELSRDFPASRDALLTQLRMGPHAEGGEIQLEGMVRSASTVDTLEAGLRDAHHRVEGKSRTHDATLNPYVWRFTSSLVVLPQASQDYLARQPAAKDETKADKKGKPPSDDKQPASTATGASAAPPSSEPAPAGKRKSSPAPGP